MPRISKKNKSKSQDKIELNNENNLIDLTSTDIKKLIKKGKEKKILLGMRLIRQFLKEASHLTR